MGEVVMLGRCCKKGYGCMDIVRTATFDSTLALVVGKGCYGYLLLRLTDVEAGDYTFAFAAGADIGRIAGVGNVVVVVGVDGHIVGGRCCSKFMLAGFVRSGAVDDEKYEIVGTVIVEGGREADGVPACRNIEISSIDTGEVAEGNEVAARGELTLRSVGQIDGAVVLAGYVGACAVVEERNGGDLSFGAYLVGKIDLLAVGIVVIGVERHVVGRAGLSSDL